MKHPVLELIKKELFLNDSLQKEFVFQSFNDGIFAFHLDDDFYQEIKVISDDTILSNMRPVDILSLKRINYLEHCVYLKNGEKLELIKSITYENKLQE